VAGAAVGGLGRDRFQLGLDPDMAERYHDRVAFSAM
jgi:hypothetical protein